MKMAPVSTYRSWLAALLLALYGFIVLPVQVWHHHAGTSCHTEKSSSPLPAYAGESGTFSGSCKICDHQYSFYYNDQQVSFVFVRRALAVVFSFHRPGPVTASYFHSSNKGPPAVD